MDADGNADVSKDEYIAFMLVELQLVERDILNELGTQFDKLDVSGDGSLNEDDLILVSNARRGGRRTVEV